MGYAIMKPKIAIYLDQVHNDPLKACELVSDIGIGNVCLRRAWSTTLNRVSNDVHIKLQQGLSTHNLNVQLTECDSGTQIAHLSDELSCVQELCKVCNAYQCQQIIVHWGKKSRAPNVKNITLWIEAVSSKTLEWAIQPLYPLSVDSAISDPAVVSSILQKSKRWKIFYDPSTLIIGGSNHITRYWSLLNQKVWGVNISDALPGSGKCALGHGNARLDIILSDWAKSGGKYWLVIRPGFKPNSVIWPQFVEYMGQLRNLSKKIGISELLGIDWGRIENARHD